ncbi:hypothetical protein [Streptomyces huiliensis]|uniref:hypothetical protein n=1 Tax=Streptomyces huiliensis TaxID=2876027 RepID=UPI001CBBCAC3|nr:hypothetical protein [Streptomyces huiliensis]MBZ4323272.1 hypothetical protein [Streptomyces huiliensis]
MDETDWSATAEPAVAIPPPNSNAAATPTLATRLGTRTILAPLAKECLIGPTE